MNLLATAQYGFAPALAQALLHSLWQCAVIGMLAALVLRLLERHGASLRHVVGMGLLLAMVIVPAVGFVRFWSLPAASVNSGVLPAISLPVAATVPGLFVQESNTVAAWLSLCWLLGVTLMLLRHVGGWRLLGAIERHPYQPLPPHWQERMALLQRALRITRTVVVRVDEAVLTPFTAHVLRPVIWLPAILLTRLAPEQLEALLAHELAHIARYDWLWNGLQCVAESLLFFHPAAWWLSRRVRQEREHACDDLAVAACGDAIALAEALAQLEHHRSPVPRLALAADGGSLMKRVTRLLSDPPLRSRWGLSLALLVLCSTGSLLAMQVTPTDGRTLGIHIESSTDGPLQAGDFREITASGVDKQRYYRIDIGVDGRAREVFRVDGREQPLDDGARAWVDEVLRLSEPPPPPEPPAPPPPPPPPPPLSFAKSAHVQAIVQLLSVDVRVSESVGQPIEIVPDSIDGSINLRGDNDRTGDAELQFQLRGPDGVARVDVRAARSNGQWTIAALSLEPMPIAR